MKIRLLSAFVVSLAVLCSASLTFAQVVSDLRAEHRSGQMFLTFTESSANATYAIYRSSLPITTLTGLKPVAQLAADSGQYRYDDGTQWNNAKPPLKNGFILCDLCPQLRSDQGLLVWTTKVSGTWHYAVQVSGAATFASVSVAEVAQAVPGVVQIEPWVTMPGGNRVAKFMAWEDYETWNPLWGHYGHKFALTQAGNAYPVQPGRAYPLTLLLHSAVSSGYLEPQGFSWDPTFPGFFLSPVDMAFVGAADPYGGSTFRGQSGWAGYESSPGISTLATETRIVRYVKAIAARREFQIDSNRLYVSGGSMGAYGVHVVYHHPGVFAAGEGSVGVVSYAQYSRNGAPPPTTPRVGSSTGLDYWKHYSLAYAAQQPGDRPPLVYHFGSNDESFAPKSYPETLAAVEAARQGLWVHWADTNHAGWIAFTTDPSGSRVPFYFRFLKNEAFPAFSNATTSVPLTAASGTRNLNLDWSSSLHPIGAPLMDTARRFEMTLKSLEGDQSADATIRNAQMFKPAAGEKVAWQNVSPDSGTIIQSGSVTADAGGLVTVRQLQIRTAGNRLILTLP